MSSGLERKEARYGMPAADQIIVNRHYTIGYSYYFRQAKWALEIVDPDRPIADFDRLNNFRPDYRVPEMFRANMDTYKGSGFDRGHLVASANQREKELQNSETFLLSNMSPQHPDFNRKIWKDLEQVVRELDSKEGIFETYVICGPIFDFDVAVQSVGDEGEFKVPIPNAYFKSVLTENKGGRLYMWSFIIPNEEATKPIEDYRVSTVNVEKYAGIELWSFLDGTKITKEKSKIRAMW